MLGFIGSELIGVLLKQKYQVSVIDNLIYEKTSLLSYISNDLFDFIRGDVRNNDLLKRSIKDVDIIIPLACLVGAPLCEKNPIDAELINYKHVQFINNIRSKEQKIIYPMTNSGYGVTKDNEIITEESPLCPISIYGLTKSKAEKDIQNGLENWTTMRLATVFGVSRRPRLDLLVNNLVLKAIKEKFIILYENQVIRNYIHILDICRAFLHIIENQKETKNQTFNIGNDDLNCSKLDLVKKIKEHIPIEIIQSEFTKDPDARNYKISSQKFYNTGFKCKYDLDYGIKELIKMINLIDSPINANY